MDLNTIIVRLGLSLVLGAVVGWEREAKDKPAGLRTLTLVSVGSTLFVVLSLDLMSTSDASQNWDPLRILNALIQGIGFLGAGTVLRTGETVRGLTTAAALWAMTAVGAAVGLGMYSTAVAGTFTILVILRVFLYVQNRWLAAADH
ncbi:MAG TPA: MgtC/SapB family protein [Anaerolineae bacterium]|nr:MgtC/SapB family protein [Anaerolineae bacterium]